MMLKFVSYYPKFHDFIKRKFFGINEKKLTTIVSTQASTSEAVASIADKFFMRLQEKKSQHMAFVQKCDF